jgi:KUP system potassium uptake protein
MTKSSLIERIEKKVIYSIMQQKPKRADLYWFIHVETTDEPYTREYKVNIIAPQDVVRIDFRLGFRVEQLIGRYFSQVVKGMVKNGEVDISSRYQSPNQEQVTGDFTFIVMQKFLSYENNLPAYRRVIMQLYFFLRRRTISEKQWFGLDDNNVEVENIPLLISPVADINLTRVH